MNEIDKQIAAHLDTLKIRFEVTGGQLTKRKDWECFAWRASFKRGHNKMGIESDYFTGIGNVTKPKFRGAPTRPTVPTAASVLYSLLLDATAIDQSFQDWCSDFGADNDSIEAFKTYQTCCEIGLKIRAFFSHEERAQLATMLQDY